MPLVLIFEVVNKKVSRTLVIEQKQHHVFLLILNSTMQISPKHQHIFSITHN